MYIIWDQGLSKNFLEAIFRSVNWIFNRYLELHHNLIFIRIIK